MFADLRLQFDRHRCNDCGRFYYVEVHSGGHGCPHCRSRYVAGLEDDLAAARATISALRGANTRLRNGRKTNES